MSNFKTWNDFISSYSALGDKSYEEKINFISDNIVNKWVPIEIKIFDVETVNDYINSCYFTTERGDISSIEIWKSFLPMRDFFVVANYLSIAYSFEECSYDNWCILENNDFFKILKEDLKEVSEDYQAFIELFNRMIDINSKYTNYELVSTITSVLAEIPKDLQAGDFMVYLNEHPNFMSELNNLLQFNDPKTKELLEIINNSAQDIVDKIDKK